MTVLGFSFGETSLTVIITAAITLASTVLANRRSKEDVDIARTAQAITTWQDLAESNKDHWDTCEEKCAKLLSQNIQQAAEISQLKAHQMLLDLKISQLDRREHFRDEKGN